MREEESYILEIREVEKVYGEKRAVDNISLKIPEGIIFGLLGPNGAGKTTLIRMITTITRPDKGRILLNGEKLAEHHPQQIGYLPEERGLYKKMKVGEHLIYLGRLKGLSKKEALDKSKSWLEKLDLSDRWDQAVEALSKGLQQQIQFIATVLHEPKLLILDEPFSGLDPVNTNRLKAEIRNLKKAGTSIIFSTHRMEQVEEICEHIALINQGKKVLEGSVDTIRQKYKPNHYAIQFRGELSPSFTNLFDIIKQEEQEVIIAWPAKESPKKLLAQLLTFDIEITSFQEILPSLNEIFIRIVNTETANS